MEKQNGKENNRLSAVIMTAVFAGFLLLFAAALLILKDKEFSETENRSLAQKPELSWQSIKDGSFTSGLESYISDQLFAKDQLVTLKTDFDRLIGKSFINGVYLVDDDGLRYVQRYKENRAQIAENAGYINDFAEGLSIPVDLMLVPNASAYTLDKLPAGADCDDQRQSIEYVRGLLSDKIGFYPMYDALAEGWSENYFRTDHHWTSRGSELAVRAYLTQSGQISSPDGLPAADYQETEEGFLGTLYSKAPTMLAKADSFLYSAGTAGVEWVNEGKKSDSIIDASYLDRKDKYAAFFGGNFAQVRITGSGSGRVLVLKDSYANSAMQHLIRQYGEIVMVDLRYYHMQESTVSELCGELNADRVIMLYNMDFLNEDRNFVWL